MDQSQYVPRNRVAEIMDRMAQRKTSTAKPPSLDAEVRKQKFSANIERLMAEHVRETAGNISSFAAAAGVSSNTVTRWIERGLPNDHGRIVSKMCERLGIDTVSMWEDAYRKTEPSDVKSRIKTDVDKFLSGNPAPADLEALARVVGAFRRSKSP